MVGAIKSFLKTLLGQENLKSMAFYAIKLFLEKDLFTPRTPNLHTHCMLPYLYFE